MYKEITNTSYNIYPEMSSLYRIMIVDENGKNDFVAAFLNKKDAEMALCSIMRDLKNGERMVIVKDKKS